MSDNSENELEMAMDTDEDEELVLEMEEDDVDIKEFENDHPQSPLNQSRWTPNDILNTVGEPESISHTTLAPEIEADPEANDSFIDINDIDLDNAELVEDENVEEVYEVVQSSASTAPANVIVDKSKMTNRKFLDSMIIRLPSKLAKVPVSKSTSSGKKAQLSANQQRVESDQKQILSGNQPRPGKGPAISTPNAQKKITSDQKIASEDSTEPVQGIGSDTVVLKPGSLNLVYGIATSGKPRTMANVIAWRMNEQASRERRMHSGVEDEYDKRIEEMRELVLSKVENEVRRDLSRKQGPLLPSVSSDDARETNVNHTPEDLSHEEHNIHRFTDVSHAPKCVIGDAALHIDPSEPYELFYPIDNGHFYCSHSRSSRASYEDLVRIWTYAIENMLGIPKKDFCNFKAFVIVPDMFNRKTAAKFMDVCMKDLGFCAAMCHQESVCTTFGAGLQSATVVNIGDQSTSISCVEDGISIPKTRLRLGFGGDDVVRALCWTFKKISFPYKGCSNMKWTDRCILRSLAHQMCHLNTTDIKPKSYDFIVPSAASSKRYCVHVVDQPVVALMGFFVPSFYGLRSDSQRSFQHIIDSSALPEDSIYGLEAEPEFQIQMKSKEEVMRSTAGENANGESTSKSKVEHVQYTKEDKEEAMKAREKKRKLIPTLVFKGAAAASASDVKADFVAVIKKEEEEKSGILSVDEAIISAIDKCSTDVVIRNMFQNIVLVGGCALYSGLAKNLEMRLKLNLPPHLSRIVERINVVTRPKNQDPRFISWKGASVAARLSSVQDAWILQSEWDEMGARIAREKSLFAW